ncbi:MAG: transglutaminase-like domain-containing protein [Bacteroidia bacterium]
MKTSQVLISLLLVASYYAQAQEKVKPEEQEFAKKTRKDYPDQDYASIKSESTYTFDIKKIDGEQKVTASLISYEQFISFKDNIVLKQRIFFDEQSEVKDIRLESAKGSKVNVFPVTSDYEANGVFYSDAKLVSFSESLPTLGMRRNVSYKKEIHDVKYLTTEYFHDSYPILEKIISFEVPDWLTVELKEVNFDGYNIEKTKEANPKNKSTVYKYKLKNLKAFKSEENAPALASSFPHIVILCKEYEDKGKHKLLSNVDDLYAWYASLTKLVKNDESVIKPTVQKLIEGKKTDEEKIKAIFYWLQDNIRYIAYENGIMGYKPETCQKVYNNKYGDCKGMANLAKVMYHSAGYDSRLTWLGTNDIPYDYSTPSLAVDNHMICTIVLNDKKYFIDPTESWIAFNDYAHRIQGRQVLIEDGPKYILDRVPSFGIERNKIETIRQVTVSSDKVTGNVKNVFNGEGKTSILRGYAGTRTDKQDEALKKFLVKENPNITLKNIKPSDFKNREQPLTVEYDFDLNNAVTKTGTELYINIEMEKNLAALSFDSTRVNDYELDNKYYISQHTEFTLPPGYKVDYMPEGVNKKNNNFSFKLTCKQEGKKIIYDKEITIDNAIIRKKDFKEWNSCIKDIRKFYNDQIVLTQ